MSIGSQPDVRIWEEPVRGSFGDLSALALPGVERMRLGSRGESARPPIHHLTGLRPVEAGYGSATFIMPVTPWLQTPVPGLITGGVFAFAADAPLGGAIISILPPLAYMTTSDLSLSFVQPATLDSQNLVARGRLIHGSRTVALSEVSIEDASGRLLAHGTSRGFLLTAPGAPPAPEDGAAPPAYETLDPYLRRPVAGQTIDIAVWNRVSGLEAMRSCVAGERVPPIRHLTGIRPTDAAEGSCTFVMPASQWLLPPAPFVYGGAIALLADAALSGAVMTTIPPGSSFASLDLKVNYLRPVLPDGGLITARASTVHRGRSFVVASAELFNEEGKKVAVGSSSAIVLARPWSDISAAGDREVPRPDERG